jgi:hypothetical protein
MALQWNAYVDESGDRGWTLRPPDLPPGVRGGSSRIFSLTAVLIPAGAEHEALRAWDVITPQVGRRPGDVVHWQNVKGHGARRHLAATVAALPNVRVISVVLCKHHLQHAAGLHDPGRLYNWTLRLLVERLSWFGHRSGDTVAATFSQVKGLRPELLHDYIDKLRGRDDTYMEWASLMLPFGISTPTNRRMLQLADTASGAIFSAFEPDDLGYVTRDYLDIVRPALWRRPGRPLWRDGLKYGPWPSAECRTEHPWFDQFCEGS